MIKRFVIVIAGFIAVVFLLGAVKVAQIKGLPAHANPVFSVSSVEAKTETWHPSLSAVGSLAPVQGVALGSEVDGTVIKIGFENGQRVHAGDTLLELDSSVEQAQLNAAQAQLALAKLQATRSSELLEKKTISQAELDQATAQLSQTQANVDGLKSLIEKKTVRAPFEGRVGIRSVNLGQYLTRGQPVVSLQNLDQLYVNFTLSERDLSKLKVGEAISISVDAFPDRKFEGKLNAINSEVNSSTRNISVQGLFSNPDEALRPGMFARVELELPDANPQVIVPETSVAYNAYGNSVFVIEQVKGQDGKEYLGVRQQFVKLGDKRGDMIAITDGLKAGETVVSAGVFKLRNNMPVKVNNSVQPSMSEDPKPVNS